MNKDQPKPHRFRWGFELSTYLLDDKTGQIVYNGNKNMPIEDFLTIKEVAKELRVSERSVMRYIKAKKLRASKMGQWRIKKKDLEHFFKANSNRK